MTFTKNTTSSLLASRRLHYTLPFSALLVTLLLCGSSTTTTARAFTNLHYNSAATTATAASRTRRRRSSTTNSAPSSRFEHEHQSPQRSLLLHSSLLSIRGGGEQTEEKSLAPEQTIMSQPQEEPPLQQAASAAHQLASLNPFAFLAPLGTTYKAALEASPILTKSATACLIFGLSDYLAQLIENKSSSSSNNKDDKDKRLVKAKKNTIVWGRTFMSAAVGFLYFGPAAHAWYDMIFRVFPGTSLFSTLQKAAMGQFFFGPSFTCIFFASSLLQSGQFTMSNWWKKIRQDLWGAWLAGIGFWPLVDVISYSVVPVVYIPLFINMCSLIWTIYLSNIANRSTAKTDQSPASSSASS